VLETNLLISSVTRRQGLGRPVQVYRLTERAEELFPHQYDVLAISLLEQVEALYGEDAIDRILEARKAQMAAFYSPRMEGKSLEERMEEASKILTENGYLGDFICEEGQYLLRACHCALGKVSRRYPLICEKELEFVSDLLGVPVVREQHQLRGDACCTYRVVLEGEKPQMNADPTPVELRQRSSTINT